MAEKITKEKKASLKEHTDELLSAVDELEKFIGKKGKYEDSVRTSFEHYLEQLLSAAKKESAEHEFKHSDLTIVFNEKHFDPETVKQAYKLKVYLGYHKAAKKLHEMHANDITVNAEESEPVYKEGTSWLFLSKEIKESALEAADNLENEYHSDFMNEVNKLLTNFNNESDEQAIKDFKENVEGYVQFIGWYTDAKLTSRRDLEMPDMHLFKEKKDKISEANHYYNVIVTQRSNFIKRIRTHVDQVVEKFTTDKLKTLSIDSIFDNPLDTRKAKLEKGDYRTLYDIYAVKTEKLADLYGMGNYNAMDLKKLVNSVADEYRKSLKISLDDIKDNDMLAELISPIYRYSQCKGAIDQAEKIHKKFYDKMKIITTATEGKDDEISWYMANEEGKLFYLKAFELLINVEKADYRNLAQRLYFLYVSNNNKLITKEGILNFYQNQKDLCYELLLQIYPDLFVNGKSIYGIKESVLKQIKMIQISDSYLKVKPKEYQIWAARMIIHAKKMILGDEMGLGGFLEALVAMASLKVTDSRNTHFMVYCPEYKISSLERFIQTKSYFRVGVFNKKDEEVLVNWKKKGGILLVSYEDAQSMIMPEKLEDMMIVFEDAQTMLKGKLRAFFEPYIETVNRVCLLNDEYAGINEDFIDMLRLVNPKLAETIDLGVASSEESILISLIPYYYRRTPKDIGEELDDIQEMDIWCHFTDKEREAYMDAISKERYSDLFRISWSNESLDESSKAKVLKKLVDKAHKNHRPVMIFSQYLDVARKVCMIFKDTKVYYLNAASTMEERNALEKEYLKDTDQTIFVSTIRSGKMPTYLIENSVVVLLEVECYPSVELHMTYHPTAIRKKRNIMVYKLLMEDSVDELIEAYSCQKRKEASELNDFEKRKVLDYEISLDQIREFVYQYKKLR